MTGGPAVTLRDMSSILVHLFRHHRWANRHMVERCRGLSDAQLERSVEGTYGTLRDTLTHLIRAEAGYTFRLTGQPRLFGREDPFPGVERMLELLEQTGHALEEVAESLGTTEMVEITTDEGTTVYPSFVILLQAVNHATEHRSHIATILTQLGIQPPELDLWAYNDEVLKT